MCCRNSGILPSANTPIADVQLVSATDCKWPNSVFSRQSQASYQQMQIRITSTGNRISLVFSMAAGSILKTAVYWTAGAASLNTTEPRTPNRPVFAEFSNLDAFIWIKKSSCGCGCSPSVPILSFSMFSRSVDAGLRKGSLKDHGKYPASLLTFRVLCKNKHGNCRPSAQSKRIYLFQSLRLTGRCLGARTRATCTSKATALWAF